MKIEYFLFSVALPGAERREGAQHTKLSLHMTRRAFLALRVIRLHWKLLKHGCQKSVNFDHKNQDFSFSMNSFRS